MPFRPSRTRSAGRWLEWKVRLFTVAAAFAIVGIYRDDRWMTGAAIAILCGAMLLRFLPGGGARGRDADEGDPGEHDPDPGDDAAEGPPS